jgi:hypothetical protein
MDQFRKEGERKSLDATEVVDLVSQENGGVLFGEKANTRYVGYLRSGGNMQNLWDAIEAASNLQTVRMITCDIVDSLTRG